MRISMILDHEACISDAGFFSVGRTDGQGDSRSWILCICLCVTKFVLLYQYTLWHPTPRIALFVRPSGRWSVRKKSRIMDTCFMVKDHGYKHHSCLHHPCIIRASSVHHPCIMLVGPNGQLFPKNKFDSTPYNMSVR